MDGALVGYIQGGPFHDKAHGCSMCGGQLEPTAELVEGGAEITILAPFP
ncbi:MAG: hypothetical protein MJE77_22465 [Proteobacteria bacterium]|nr:hypothetical protein [Pseudomonadota bacterium]